MVAIIFLSTVYYYNVNYYTYFVSEKEYLMMRRVGTVLGSMEFGRGQCIDNMPQV